MELTLFEKATKAKLRYQTSVGFVSTEDLWDLSLDQLDKTAISVNKEVKASEEESFVKEQPKANSKAVLALEVLKQIIAFKKEEKAAKSAEKDRQARKEILLAALADKQEAKLKSLSEEEILAELGALA